MSESQKAPQKKAAQTSDSVKASANDIAIVAGWIGLQPDDLEHPDAAIAKTVVHTFATRYANKGNIDELKPEIIQLFNNPVGQQAVQIASNASNNADSLAFDMGKATGAKVRDGMKQAFDRGFVEGLQTPNPNEVPMEVLGKLQMVKFRRTLDAGLKELPKPKDS